MPRTSSSLYVTASLFALTIGFTAIIGLQSLRKRSTLDIYTDHEFGI